MYAWCIRRAVIWWVAPTYGMAMVGWRKLEELIPQQLIANKSISERYFDVYDRFDQVSRIWVKSADNPDSLRGEGLDLAIIDEAAFVKEEAWTAAIRPALADKLGRGVFISTPLGRNWFWRVFLQGQADDPEWKSWTFKTLDNPHIAPSEIEAARRDLPERIFRQEFDAEFLEDAGAVFRNVSGCVVDEAKRKGDVVIGVDWGKHEDFTVLTAIDRSTGQVIDWDRFNQIDYAVQRGRLAAMAKRVKPTVILAESNAMGEPIIEQLVRDGLPVRGFTTTQASKAMIIEGLALAFEKAEIGIPAEQVLVNELQAFEMTRLPGGATRYSAPSGLHDDCVISLALAWHAARGMPRPALAFSDW